jgi:dipeptidase E
MKLYLSSYRLGAKREVLRDLVTPGNRAALVYNARDVYKDRMRDAQVNAGDIASLGFTIEELDLREYFGEYSRLHERLEALDLLWVVGGNTFALARAMYHSHFREVLLPLLEDDRIVYAGYSAGACIAGPDLRGCHLMDEPGAASLGYPEGYAPDIAADSLNLVSFRPIPHWRSDHEESGLAELAADYVRDEVLEHWTIRDGQAIVVADGIATLV